MAATVEQAWRACLVVGLMCAAVGATWASPSQFSASTAVRAPAASPAFERGPGPSFVDAQGLAQWLLDRHDPRGRPFAIVDKRLARIHVFAADGRLLGDAAALLGLTRGDDPATAIGQGVELLSPQHRTTPAGRYESEPGHNHKGEANVWIDYDASLAIHRLRPADPAERRPQRLASATPDDNRISLGCVVVDGRFYDRVVAPTLGRERGVVYVLPESRDWRTMFGVMAADAR